MAWELHRTADICWCDDVLAKSPREIGGEEHLLTCLQQWFGYPSRGTNKACWTEDFNEILSDDIASVGQM